MKPTQPEAFAGSGAQNRVITQMPQWREQPIFISSTFKDMQAERDILHDTVFPNLRKRLVEYHITLAPVDLRNGVETVGAKSQEAKELQVLSVCLDEINRCKPFLLVILGERYGWVPDRERMDEAVGKRAQDDAYAALREIKLADKSVTHLEIEFGALASKEQQKRTIFFFRNLQNAEAISGEKKPIYDDRASKDARIAARHSRLAALKDEIRNNPEFKGKYSMYTGRYNPATDSVVDLDKWASDVEELLWKQIEADCLAYEAKMMLEDKYYHTWQSAERRAMYEFLQSRTERFVGRCDDVEQCVRWLCGEAVKPGLCVTGEAGAGKSALFARVYSQLDNLPAERKPIILCHTAGVSSRAGSLEMIVSRWLHELVVTLTLSQYAPAFDPATELTTLDEKIELLFGLIAQAAQRNSAGLAIMIDSLDCLDNTKLAQTMNWLPQTLPANVRFLSTAIPCNASNALVKRSWCVVVPIEPFVTSDDYYNAYAFIEAQCTKLHKNNLDEQVADALCSVTNSKTGQPACANPLWLAIAVNRLLNLDADDFNNIDALKGLKPDEQIQYYRIDRAHAMPGLVEDMYDDYFSYCAESFGRRVGIGWIHGMLDYLACSRHGLRE